MEKYEVGQELVCIKDSDGCKKDEVWTVKKTYSDKGLDIVVLELVKANHEQMLSVRKQLHISKNIIDKFFAPVTKANKEEELEKFKGVDPDKINKLMVDSEFTYDTVYDKTCVVIMRLPNGFTLTETYSFFSPEDYDEDTAYEICVQKLKVRLYELEAYHLHCLNEIYE